MSSGRVTIAIPDTPPSLNRWMSGHWRVRHREKQQWESLIAAECNRRGLPVCDRIEAHVIFTFGDRRKRDLDNFTGTISKCLGDALKITHIPDDDHLRFAVIGAKINPEPGPKQTIIVLDWFREVEAAA